MTNLTYTRKEIYPKQKKLIHNKKKIGRDSKETVKGGGSQMEVEDR